LFLLAFAQGLFLVFLARLLENNENIKVPPLVPYFLEIRMNFPNVISIDSCPAEFIFMD